MLPKESRKRMNQEKYAGNQSPTWSPFTAPFLKGAGIKGQSGSDLWNCCVGGEGFCHILCSAPSKLAAQEVYMKGRKINPGENKNQNNFTEIQRLSVNSSLTKFILTEIKWLLSNQAPADVFQSPPPLSFNQNFSQGNQLPILLTTLLGNTPDLSLLKPFSQATLKTLSFPTPVEIFQKSLPGWFSCKWQASTFKDVPYSHENGSLLAAHFSCYRLPPGHSLPC